MNPDLTEIIIRDTDTIQREIEALEREINDDLSPAKASYKFNLVLHKIALVNRDISTLAVGMAEILENQHTILERQKTQAAMLNLLCEIRQMEKLGFSAKK